MTSREDKGGGRGTIGVPAEVEHEAYWKTDKRPTLAAASPPPCLSSGVAPRLQAEAA